MFSRNGLGQVSVFLGLLMIQNLICYRCFMECIFKSLVTLRVLLRFYIATDAYQHSLFSAYCLVKIVCTCTENADTNGLVIS